MREQAVADLQEAPDAMAVGLIFAAPQEPFLFDELLARHRQAVEAELRRLALKRKRGLREGFLRPSVYPLEAAAFRRSKLRAAAELAWHEECDQMLAGYEAAEHSGRAQRG